MTAPEHDPTSPDGATGVVVPPAAPGIPTTATAVAPPPTEQPPPPGSPAPEARPPSTWRWVRELLIIVAIALAIAGILRVTTIQTFYIPSGSMEPTLQIGDRILVDKLSYHLHGVQRGDIVVFARPADENCGGPPVNDLVKRVIGLPGETISLSDDQVVIDGRILKEPWLPAGVATTPDDSNAPWSLEHPYKIPAGEYYLMGDNRPASCDSRYWGPIPRSLIVGKVVMRIWPLSSIRFF